MRDGDRYLIPELNMAANDAELRNIQRRMLNETYQRQIEQKNRRVPPKEYLYYGRSRMNPQYPVYPMKEQVEQNIRLDLAQAYQKDMEIRQARKREQKLREKEQEELMLQKTKQIEERDRRRAQEMRKSFYKEAMEQVKKKEMKKLEEKKQIEEEKQSYQKRYSTNLLGLNKQKSFKDHFSSVNGLLEQHERNYVSMVLPKNNQREREKDRVIEEGIKKRTIHLQSQLQHQYDTVSRHRQDLRDSLMEQMKEKEERKKRELQRERAEQYTTINYKNRYHPINNPVDFKITHDNKYILGQLQSGLARSGSKALLS